MADTIEANRPWLEPDTDQELHYFGFRKRKWNPSTNHGFYALNTATIDYSLQRAAFLAEHGDLDAAKDAYVDLVFKAPNNVAVLEKCVEFENGLGNKTAAEAHLCCLISLEPTNEEYAKKRAELLPNVDYCDDFRLDEIDQQLTKYALLRPTSEELHENRKKAFFERLAYNTLAIEGNKLSAEDVRAIVENQDDRGFRARSGMEADHLEVHGMIDVLNHIRRQKYTQEFLRDKFDLKELNKLHELLLRDKPAAAGQLRCTAVWLHGVPFEPVDFQLVPEEMDNFIKFMRANIGQVMEQKINAVECATLVHYYLVHVHPYSDGNGRLSRLLLNIVLEAFGLPPITVPFVERRTYMAAIFRANMGELRTLIRLIAQFVYRTVAAAVSQQAMFPELETDDPQPKPVYY